MTTTGIFRAVATLVPLVAAVSAIAAPPSPAQRCMSAKVLAAGAETRARIVCLQRFASDPEIASCVARAAAQRSSAFARAEARGGCSTSGDASLLGEIAERTAHALRELLLPAPTTSRCSGAQLAAAGRAVGTLSRAYAAHERSPDEPRRAAALVEVEAQFRRAFARAVALGDCSTASDASQAWAAIAYGAAAIPGNLRPTCGDDVQAGDEACDGSDDASCSGACLASCTCGSTCGDGVLQPGEQCDGTSCDAADPNGCFPRSWSDECQCCALTSPCYVRTGGSSSGALPCCAGECLVPGPEAGPDVTVYCSVPSGATCPCFTSASLDAAFPPGFFDASDRGGASCTPFSNAIAGVAANDTCFVPTLPLGELLLFPRGGAAVMEHLCTFMLDEDPLNQGFCNQVPDFGTSVTEAERAACVAELRASQAFQAACD